MIGAFDGGSHRTPMSEINVTPMVDVMLVLLVIFIVTAPLLTHSIPLDLPRASSDPNRQKPDRVSLAIDSEGRLYWNDALLDRETLSAKLAQAAAQLPQPELQLRADKETRYRVLADVMAEAQRLNLQRVGFVTQPEPAR